MNVAGSDYLNTPPKSLPETKIDLMLRALKLAAVRLEGGNHIDRLVALRCREAIQAAAV